MTEISKTLEILEEALQLEVDGRQFYLDSAERGRTNLAGNLFRTLADEELEHQKAIRTIYEKIKAGQPWPAEVRTAGPGEKIETLFSEALQNPEERTEPASTELDAVRIALDMEDKSFRLYRDRGKQATDPAEIRFYSSLAKEEKQHYMSLIDTEEYLTDPEGWFAKKQHISLDGA